jgi:predicted nucleic acid-binding protein
MLPGAWGRRANLRLVDALYVELAEVLGAPLVTTDAALAAAVNVAELIEAPE